MSSTEAAAPSRTLLWHLAESPLGGRPPVLRYDAERKISQVLQDGGWVDSWDATVLSGTKKFDVETGEDAKGQ